MLTRLPGYQRRAAAQQRIDGLVRLRLGLPPGADALHMQRAIGIHKDAVGRYQNVPPGERNGPLLPIILSGFGRDRLGHALDHAFRGASVISLEGMIDRTLCLPRGRQLRQRALNIDDRSVLPLLFKPSDRRVDATVKADIGGLIASAAQPFDDFVAIPGGALVIKIEVAFGVAVADGRRHQRTLDRVRVA